MRKTNTTGKPYAGKPHVRFDEGAEEHWCASWLYSTVLCMVLNIIKYDNATPDGVYINKG